MLIRQCGMNELKYHVYGVKGQFNPQDAGNTLRDLYKILSAKGAQQRSNFDDLASLFTDLRDVSIDQAPGLVPDEILQFLTLKSDEAKILAFDPYNQSNTTVAQEPEVAAVS